MSAAPATLSAPTSAAPRAASDEARLLIAEQLQMLKRVAQVGLEVSLEIERQARGDVAEGQKPAPVGDIALAFARTARAMRLTVLLQSRLAKDLAGLDEAGVKASAEAGVRADEARAGLEQARKGSVERIVGRVAEAAGEDEDKVEALVLEASERLDDDDIYGDVLARPVSEVVADICQDLGLKPDWPRLAAEAWAQAEIGAGPAGAPLRGLEPDTRPRRPAPPPFHPLRPGPPRAVSRKGEGKAEGEGEPTHYVYSWLPDEEPDEKARPLPLAGEGDHEVVERAFGSDTG